MRIHYIIHAPFEKLGVIKNWIDKKHYPVTSTHTYRGERLPESADIDLLIIAGGPQSAVTLDDYPYLKDEVAFTKKVIREKKAVLGICLGAQIISAALGAKAERSPNREIGVFPIQLTEEGKLDPVFQQFSHRFDVLHWHNDMPGIPYGAVTLATSQGCPRQAFRYGDRVYGLQFHLEMTQDALEEMILHCRHDLKPGQYVQSADVLMQQDLSSINQKMHVVLDYLANFKINSTRELS